ncbi:regulatory protein, MarR [Thermogladius calderae 1633]|uniref:Regulatory protein, MarR n=1 Tax=Thermogladius calderae (strain DSM 22663 / VKM B-2946 / 1633) TaxID=1184251 RepID=I3TFI5_THEC1|nr:winged helix-turn-helix domain-containing protein [Thermogladius calderae]AFK51523.1 regulatory protein, MarR [Thermogladius calderae 1633]
MRDRLLKQSHLKILLLSDENGYLDLGSVQQKLNLTMSSLRKYVRQLEKDGLVARSEKGLVLTEKGLKLKKTILNLKTKRDVPAYLITDPSTGQPVPVSFKSYAQLYALLAYDLVDKTLVDKHIAQGYLANWARDAVGDEYLASLIQSGGVKNSNDLLSYLKMILQLVAVEK